MTSSVLSTEHQALGKSSVETCLSKDFGFYFYSSLIYPRPLYIHNGDFPSLQSLSRTKLREDKVSLLNFKLRRLDVECQEYNLGMYYLVSGQYPD